MGLYSSDAVFNLIYYLIYYFRKKSQEHQQQQRQKQEQWAQAHQASVQEYCLTMHMGVGGWQGSATLNTPSLGDAGFLLTDCFVFLI